MLRTGVSVAWAPPRAQPWYFMIADLAMERPLRRRRWFQQCDIEFFPAKLANR